MTTRNVFRAARAWPAILFTAVVLSCSDSDPTEPDDSACNVRTTLTLAVPVSGELTTGDCVAAATFADHYTWTASANQAVLMTLASTAFDPSLLVTNAAGTLIIAQNNDAAPGNQNSRIKLVAAPGAHTVTATSAVAGAAGPYTLTVNNTSASAENCELIFLEIGVTTQQSLDPTDCVLNPPFNDDQFRVYLAAGTRVRITMRSAAMDAFLELYAPSGAFVTDDDDSGGGTTGRDAQIVHNISFAGFYIISASSEAAGQTGAYTLTVELAAAGTSATAQLLPDALAKPGARQRRTGR